MDIVSFFGNLPTAIIFILSVLAVIFLVTKYGRAYSFAKISFVILVIIIYQSCITPLIIDILCGDPIKVSFLQILSLNFLPSDMYVSFYIFIQSIHPFVGLNNDFNFILSLFGTFLCALLLMRFAKGLLVRDKTEYKSRAKKGKKEGQSE